MDLKDLLAVSVPPRLAVRPRDRRGFPIPYGVLCDDNGVPDFRVTDLNKWFDAVNHRRCGLCAQQLGRKIAFVGGEKCHVHRVFADLPMHRDCAEYALQVCPYLALSRMKHATSLKVDATYLGVSAVVSGERPEQFMLGIAADFEVIKHGHEYLLRAQPWLESVWWKDGVRLP
jgi:hypothetical protein